MVKAKDKISIQNEPYEIYNTGPPGIYMVVGF